MTPTPTLVDEPSTALTGTPSWTPLDIPPVKNPKDEQFVSDYMNLAKAFQTKVRDFFKPHKDRAFAAHRGLCQSENEALRTAVETEEACKKVLVAYRREVEELQRQERLRLEELARKQEEERRIQEAAALESAASANPDLVEASEQRREAETLIEAPLPMPVVPMERPAAAKGSAYKDKWGAAMTDKVKLILAVAERIKEQPDLAALFDLNQTQANRKADALKKDQTEILPGLMCVREINVAGRRR